MEFEIDDYKAAEQRYERMTYARSGASGVMLPRLSLGFWHNFGDATAYSKSRSIALAAFDNGITHFDLADNYGPSPGAAETFLGRLLYEELGRYRDELFISTKAAFDMWRGPYGTYASRKHLIASLDQSLRRMRLDYVDLFYCHRFDPHTPLEETLQTLVDIVRSGKALYIGVSNWPADALRIGIEYLQEHGAPLLIYQGRMNIFDREPEQKGITDVLASKRKGFITFSPLAQGLLSGRYLNGIPADSRMAQERYLKSNTLTPHMLAKLHKLDDLARQRGETLAQMSLAWLMNREVVTSVLVGASGKEQLLENIKAVGAAPFTDEELRLIDDIALA
ncbi:MAG: aldo/keto reductase [Prevotella sp.]|nr:aldo/keto reductase [Prevotella sp.]